MSAPNAHTSSTESDHDGFEPALVTSVLGEVMAERYRQHEKWGQQNHPNGTGEDWNCWNGQGSGHIQREAERKREDCERHFGNGTGSYADILTEEFYEALAEDDPARLRAELIQVAAVAVAWVEKVDRETVPAAPAFPAGHGYTPHTGPFGTGEGCRVMLARYPCNYSRDEHDPDLPPVDVDVFGYRRKARCCPGEGTMAHVRGCQNHPEADR